MESFGNLAYTLGGNIVQGSGIPGNYTPIPPSTNCPPNNNGSPYSLAPPYGHGGQMSGQSVRMENNNVNGYGGILPGQQRNFTNQNQQFPRYNQPQSITSTGASSFQFRNSYEMPQPQATPFYNNGQAAQFKSEGNSNIFGNGVFPDEKPLGCHVKVGNAGDQAVIYCGYYDPQSRKNFDDSSMNQQQGQFQQQQGQLQQQQISMPSPQMGYNNVQNSVTYPMQGQQQQESASTMQIPNNENGARVGGSRSYTPCGNCQACRFNLKVGQQTRENPHLVRGPPNPNRNMQKNELCSTN